MNSFIILHVCKKWLYIFPCPRNLISIFWFWKAFKTVRKTFFHYSFIFQFLFAQNFYFRFIILDFMHHLIRNLENSLPDVQTFRSVIEMRSWNLRYGEFRHVGDDKHKITEFVFEDENMNVSLLVCKIRLNHNKKIRFAAYIFLSGLGFLSGSFDLVTFMKFQHSWNWASEIKIRTWIIVANICLLTIHCCGCCIAVVTKRVTQVWRAKSEVAA